MNCFGFYSCYGDSTEKVKDPVRRTRSLPASRGASTPNGVPHSVAQSKEHFGARRRGSLEEHAGSAADSRRRSQSGSISKVSSFREAESPRSLSRTSSENVGSPLTDSEENLSGNEQLQALPKAKAGAGGGYPLGAPPLLQRPVLSHQPGQAPPDGAHPKWLVAKGSSKGPEPFQPRNFKLTQTFASQKPREETAGREAVAANSRTAAAKSAKAGERLPRLTADRSLSLEALQTSDLYWKNANKLAELRVFTYNELRAATRNFANDLLLGIGGFGAVYKGFLKPVTSREKTDPKGRQLSPQPSLIEVAIKKLDAKSLQGHKEWMTEVSLLGLIEHPHLVKLLGYCVEHERRLLVYEYLPNTSLDRFMFGTDRQPLDWNTRLKVAVGTARGLAYLHEEVDPSVIYRDFKTSNVLLDTDFHPKLSDFGLAREGPTGEDTHVSTQVRGTAGYAAPEYMLTGHLTPKNDVWSFGVVLLELLTGRPCLDRRRPPGEHNLVQFCRPYLNSPVRFHHVMDPRLQGQYPPRGIQKAAELAKWCLTADHFSRPLMSEVVAVLTFLQGLREPGGPGGRDWGEDGPVVQLPRRLQDRGVKSRLPAG